MKTQRQVFDIVVVGGGTVGAAVALGLRRAGWQVAVVEQRSRPVFSPAAPVTRVALLNAASIACLEQLEVLPAGQDPRMLAVARMQVWDAHSDAALTFDADSLGMPALGWSAEHLVLESLLWDAMEAEGVALFAEQPWKHLDLRTEAVDLHLADRVLSASLVIAADGAESRLRQQAGIAVRRNAYGSAVVATVRTEYPHADTAWQRFNDEEILAFLPLQDGSCSIVWSVPDYRAEQIVASDPEGFAGQLAAALGHRLGAIVEQSPRFCYPLVGRQAEEYGRNRLLVIGDAAHTIHPLAGQGLNLGLADVTGLLDLLSNPRGVDPGSERLLRTFTRTRRFRTEMTLRAMETLRWGFGPAGSVQQFIRSWGVQRVQRSPVLQQFFAQRAAYSLW